MTKANMDMLENQNLVQELFEKIENIKNNNKTPKKKQTEINDLYDNFVKTNHKKWQSRLGIVHTPPEVVDFILNSVNDVLKEEFGCDLNSKNVKIYDPFTGTGTFISQLLRSGMINKSNLERKYKKEIFANEILPLGYILASLNIADAFRDAMGNEEYVPFENLRLTDTFEDF